MTQITSDKKWNESGFRPLLCTYRLNWAWITSWGWWDEWDGTALQTQDSKFKPWRSEAVHATSWSHKLPIILTFTSGWGRNIFVSFKSPRPGNEPWTLAWNAAVLTTTPWPPPRTSVFWHYRWRLSVFPLCVVLKGSYIEVYSGIEFPKHDFQFNHDTNCRIYVDILHHSGLSYNMF